MIAVFSPSVGNMQALLKRLDITNCRKINGLNVFKSNLNGQSIILAETAPDKTNVGMIQGIICEKYDIDYAIIQGDCASLNANKSKILDIAISSESFQFDINFTAIGYPITVIPIIHESIFSASNTLIHLASKAAKLCKYKSYSGVYASSSTFIASNASALCLRKKFNANFVDTECSSGLETSFMNNTPTVCVKGVCNYANNNANCDFQKYYKEADNRSCDVIYKMICLL